MLLPTPEDEVGRLDLALKNSRLGPKKHPFIPL